MLHPTPFITSLMADVKAITEDFNIMDAASADYARREMDKADAEFEKGHDHDCPICGSVMVDARCTNQTKDQI